MNSIGEYDTDHEKRARNQEVIQGPFLERFTYGLHTPRQLRRSD
jgi:hypothetical protein